MIDNDDKDDDVMMTMEARHRFPRAGISVQPRAAGLLYCDEHTTVEAWLSALLNKIGLAECN